MANPAQKMATMLGFDSNSGHLQDLNQGAADIAARVTGSKENAPRGSAPYYTNNEGQAWPDPAHSKNIGGIPLISDTFLLQKQQGFNRSKNLERMVGRDAEEVHACAVTVLMSALRCTLPAPERLDTLRLRKT